MKLLSLNADRVKREACRKLTVSQSLNGALINAAIEVEAVTVIPLSKFLGRRILSWLHNTGQDAEARKAIQHHVGIDFP
ncbi:MAG: hypothetical protein WBF53_07265 [Litorimonas sp.]